MIDPRSHLPQPTAPADTLLALWGKQLEDTPAALSVETGRFMPEPWHLPPAERGAPPG